MNKTNYIATIIYSNVKLSPILSKFLAANKQLSLPGIGTFYSDGAYNIDGDEKKADILSNVTFKREKVTKADEELIDFITKETGKMRVLATSDLSSQLEDVSQYLNSGKPYFFTGIGTLTRKQNGDFDFHPQKYGSSAESKKETPITEKNYVPKSYIDGVPRSGKNIKPAIIIITLSLIAIAATVLFYLKSQEKQGENEEIVAEDAKVQPSTTLADTATSVGKDRVSPPANSASGVYTYVLEIAKEPRASKRFNQLKTINWPVELENVDSVNKRIVMKLNSPDTTRMKDSLRILSGRKVWISR
ncbi:MAG: hypothetical protein BGN92_00735 [Sphingobacteriales bacterium 41-5]|nr:MAG: hypothetical protein ABS67_01455 [Niabella sp. SCN 42-15]OJU27423.1 MAG: hypothetical protein BGN92_00735 [Sphingobacteriales bacterium 41-5]